MKDILNDEKLKQKCVELSDKELPAFISSNKFKNRVCKLTMSLFFEFLAIAASSVALQGLPFGGLFITGGVIPQNLDLLFETNFMQNFVNNFQKSKLLKLIPVYIVTDL